jgi:teichuronic acid biosynthesis glycosyltransferase TuaC
VRILVFSSLYPSATQPRHGIFTERRIRHLLLHSGAEIRVVAPVPWFPFKGEMFGEYGVWARSPTEDVRHGIPISYFRYPTIPRVGMSLQPFLMAGALAPKLQKCINGGFHFDVIDAYTLYPDGVAAALLARHFKVPLILTAYGSDVYLYPRFGVPRRLIQWAARHAGAISTVSQALADELAVLGVSKAKTHVIRNGVDRDLFRPPEDRAAVRARLALNGPTLLSVGTLKKLKGHELMLRALALVPDVALLLVGSGPEGSRLKRQASDLGIADRVRFLGQIDPNLMPAYYGAADALLHTSWSEGIPNVLLESIACGTPVIATNVGGVAEVVNVPDAGLLVATHQPEAVAHAIRTLVARPIDREVVCNHADRYSWGGTASAHFRMLQGVVAKGV